MPYQTVKTFDVQQCRHKIGVGGQNFYIDVDRQSDQPFHRVI